MRKKGADVNSEGSRLGQQTFSLDKYQKEVLDYVEQGYSLFVTGKAGTGKTVVLKRIKEMYEGKKVVAVLAHTGVAARNAGGFTMHSFLRIPVSTPYLPNHKIKPELYKLSNVSAKTLRTIDILVIDEISMVRCDMLDAADDILRHYRMNDDPFGGVQLVMFGDLYQLSPVTSAEDRETLSEYYQEMYFFCSHALRKINYKVVELLEIHRQDEHDFIDLLNHIRVDAITPDDIKLLNSRYEPDFKVAVTDNIVTLMTHNKQTNNYNRAKYELLNGEEKKYTAEVTGYWRENNPVDYYLWLKVGSRIMFQKNDNLNSLYENGTMGWVVSLGDDMITVRTDKNKIVEVEKAIWEQYDYYVDKTTKTIYTERTATYSQIPLKLAWAVSIHKSQGLTFDEVVIDASKSFTFGQVYVALSRCRTLKGIHLISKIPSQKIIADNIVHQYMACIDENRNVNLPDSFETEIFEMYPLELSVGYKTFDKILDGAKKKYSRVIQNEFEAKQIFQYFNGEICINKTFASIQKKWKYSDTNNGDCPFIVRNYNKVEFFCEYYNMYATYYINGKIAISLDTDVNKWKFTLYIGEEE